MTFSRIKQMHLVLLLALAACGGQTSDRTSPAGAEQTPVFTAATKEFTISFTHTGLRGEPGCDMPYDAYGYNRGTHALSHLVCAKATATRILDADEVTRIEEKIAKVTFYEATDCTCCDGRDVFLSVGGETYSEYGICPEKLRASGAGALYQLIEKLLL